METRKSKNKVIAALAVLVSMFAGITAMLFTLPKTGAVYAAEKSFNADNPSDDFKNIEVGDYLTKLYWSLSVSEDTWTLKAWSKQCCMRSTLKSQTAIAYGIMRLASAIDESVLVFVCDSSPSKDIFDINLYLMPSDIYDTYGDNTEDLYNYLTDGKHSGFKSVNMLSNNSFNLSYESQVVSIYNPIISFERAISTAHFSSLVSKSLFIEKPETSPDPGTGGSGNQGGSSGETDNPGSGSGSGGSGSQGGSSGGSENPGDNTPGDDNKGTETPKFSLDKVSYICIGVIAVSAAVVIILNRRKKNKIKG